MSSASSTSSLSLSSTSIVFPFDLIIIISRLFDSAIDALNFSLICRRHYSIVLSKIKEKENKDSQRFLDLYARRIIGVMKINSQSGKYPTIDCWSHLPCGLAHGTDRSYDVCTPDYIKHFYALAKEDEEIRKNNDDNDINNSNKSIRKSSRNNRNKENNGSKNFNLFSMFYQHLILTPEIQAKALSQLEEVGRLAHESIMYFGKCEGQRKEYDRRIPSLSLTEEKHFSEGELHGEQNTWNNGHLKKKRNYSMGKLNGLQYKYSHSGLVLQRESFKDDKLDGIVEHYDRLAKCDYPVLTYRAFYSNGQCQGLIEHWDPESGIRTAVSKWKDGKEDGQHLKWDFRTAMCKGVSHWKNGTVIDQFEFNYVWDSNGDLKTSLTYKWEEGVEKLIKTVRYQDGKIVNDSACVLS